MEHKNQQPLSQKQVTKIVSFLDLQITLTEARKIMNLTKKISIKIRKGLIGKNA